MKLRLNIDTIMTLVDVLNSLNISGSVREKVSSDERWLLVNENKDVFSTINFLINNPSEPSQKLAAQILMANTETDQKVFQRLSDAERKQLRQSPNWKNLQTHLAPLMSSQPKTQDVFQRAFQETSFWSKLTGSSKTNINTNQITVERVDSTKLDSRPTEPKANDGTKLIDETQVQLNCPKPILEEFRRIIKDTDILGASYTNPYTGQVEYFPTDARDLTAKHLQILARNEHKNVSGEMNVGLYQNKLNANQIAQIRCLVKATTVAGITYSIAYGGFPRGDRIPLPNSPKTIVIDQAGLQWQEDFRNTGGMFFYPNNPQDPNLPTNYSDWQKNMYQTMYGEPRPETPSQNTMPVRWLAGEEEQAGVIDLDQLSKAIATEFSQALDAAANQGRFLDNHEKINFRFLKAGMGFFSAGLKDKDSIQFELARLKGIEQALSRIAALPPEQQQAALGKIKRIELPFSAICPGIQNTPPEFESTLTNIQAKVQALGLEMGSCGGVDALQPTEGYVNAVTNCADPHAMPGNEGGKQSVDAVIALNTYVEHLNAGINKNIQLRESPSFYASETQQLAQAAVQSSSSTSNWRMQMQIVKNDISSILNQFLTLMTKGMNQGQWEGLNPERTLEVGRTRRADIPGLATNDIHIELKGNQLVVMSKIGKYLGQEYSEITDPQARQEALESVFNHLTQASENQLYEKFLTHLMNSLQVTCGEDIQAKTTPWIPLANAGKESGINVQTGQKSKGQFWEFGYSKFSKQFCITMTNERDRTTGYQFGLNENGGGLDVHSKGTPYRKLEGSERDEAIKAACQVFPDVQNIITAIKSNQETQEYKATATVHL